MRTPTSQERRALAIAPLRRQLRRLAGSDPGEPAPAAVVRRARAAGTLAEILEPVLADGGVSAQERAEIALAFAELEILAERRSWEPLRGRAHELERRVSEVERRLARRGRRGRRHAAAGSQTGV